MPEQMLANGTISFRDIGSLAMMVAAFYAGRIGPEVRSLRL
jgi:hypothetical protein